jgi:hypothetical protein
MTPGFKLESCPNQLSKFGYRQTPDRLLTDSWHTPDLLQTDSTKSVGDDTRSQFGELSKSALQIWRAVQFGYYQTPNRHPDMNTWRTPYGPLTDSDRPLTIWLLSDSQKSPHRHPMDSTPNRLHSLFSYRHTSNPKTKDICWRWQQVSIWLAVQISSQNLESCPNQLSKFGELSRSAFKILVSIRLLTDPPTTNTWQTPDEPPTDPDGPQWTPTDPDGPRQTPDRPPTDPQRGSCDIIKALLISWQL